MGSFVPGHHEALFWLPGCSSVWLSFPKLSPTPLNTAPFPDLNNTHVHFTPPCPPASHTCMSTCPLPPMYLSITPPCPPASHTCKSTWPLPPTCSGSLSTSHTEELYSVSNHHYRPSKVIVALSSSLVLVSHLTTSTDALSRPPTLPHLLNC